MSEKLGMVLYGADSEYVFLGRDMTRSKDYSETTAQEIDAEVKRIIDDSFRRAEEILTTYRDKLELIAKALLEYETLEGSQVEDIVRTGRFTPPPPAADSGPLMGAPAGTPVPEPPPKHAPPTLPGLGTPAPAPAT
jgi:cell division protease FtsH